jgi:alginate O-acetyltransferase complex protein AlgI
MLFDSPPYWIFFAAVFFVVAQVTPFQKKLVVVIASFIFYGFWDVRFVALLLGSAVFNYWTGLEIDRGSRRRLWVAFAVAANLALLGVFKYYDFFADSLARLLSLDPATLVLRIILPVGISFFTFEGIAYNVDVYRGATPARRSFLDFALFISFFPHLVAGPIIRPHGFFPQVDAPHSLRFEDFKWGAYQIVKGLIKKMVFADALAVHANAYFAGGPASGTSALVGIASFGLQIYFDFAGYTDIARGCARLLGYRFPPNFDRPYFSRNIGEFWRRWHISLSSWLRDYLYVPLGGNRVGVLKRYRNYIIVMGLGGLWHGASWNFLAWGLYHGALLSAHRAFLDYAPRAVVDRFDTAYGQLLGRLVTLAAVFIGWIPFRAPTLHAMLDVFRDLASGAFLSAPIPADLVVLSALAALYCLVDYKRAFEKWVETRANAVAFIAASGTCLWLMSLFMVRDVSIPFIYFQF